MAGKVSVELLNSERRVSDSLRAENERLREALQYCYLYGSPAAVADRARIALGIVDEQT
jgi:hypothetical protein